MKNYTLLIVLLCFLLIIVSCSNKKEIIANSDEYVLNHICPLFENSEIVEWSEMFDRSIKIETGNQIIKFNDIIKHLKFINMLETDLLNFKGRSFQNTSLFAENNELKEHLIIIDLKQSEIDAIKKANINEGYYCVSMTIKYKSNKYITFNIIVTKNFEVLNEPIDINKIDVLINDRDEDLMKI